MGITAENVASKFGITRLVTYLVLAERPGVARGKINFEQKKIDKKKFRKKKFSNFF